METAYSISLFLHSWNRWIILIAGIVVLSAAINGYSRKLKYSNFQRIGAIVFMSSLHLQLLVGLAMYLFLSPITAQALSDFGAAMKEPVLRYWSVEHASVNFLAICAAQIGSYFVKDRLIAIDKQKHSIIWTSIALVLLLAMTPMGMMGVDRPWFRF